MAKRGFNLLRPQLSPPTAWDKIYQWMVGTARIIVIIVQIIVIAAFAIRIYVDTVGNQLDEDIAQKDAVLETLKFTEEQIEETQIRADFYQQLWGQSSNDSKYMSFINGIIGEYEGIINVGIRQGGIDIRGKMREINVADLENRLKERVLAPGQTVISTSDEIWFVSVELSSVESDDEGQGIVDFSMIITLPNEDNIRELEI